MRWLVELGISAQGMSGPVPLSWSDVYAWASLTGTDLLADEALQIMNLSRLYCEQFYASKDPMCQSPIKPQDPKEMLDSQFEQLFRQFQ
jgi:hypothetical protein